MRDRLAALHDRYLDPPIDNYEAQIAKTIINHWVELDMVLDILGDLKRAFDKEGFDTSEFDHAMTAVAEVVREVYPGFTPKLRIGDILKEENHEHR